MATEFHIYSEFHKSKIIIHRLDGLFGPDTLTSSQLACYLNCYSAAPVSQSSWVQIPYGPEFFQVLFSTTRFSNVLSCEDLLISSLHRSANI